MVRRPQAEMISALLEAFVSCTHVLSVSFYWLGDIVIGPEAKIVKSFKTNRYVQQNTQ